MSTDLCISVVTEFVQILESWKLIEFKVHIFQVWKMLESGIGNGKSWKIMWKAMENK